MKVAIRMVDNSDGKLGSAKAKKRRKNTCIKVLTYKIKKTLVMSYQLSLTILHSSSTNFPSLYFCDGSTVLSYFQPNTSLQSTQCMSAIVWRPVVRRFCS